MTILDIMRRSAGPPGIVQADGDLDLATQHSFESTVFHELDRTSLVVDLSRLDFLAISALRSLLLADRYAAQRGRGLVFVEPTGAGRRLLDVSRLDAVLVVRRSLTEACKELRSLPEALRTVHWTGDTTAGEQTGTVVSLRPRRRGAA